MIDLNDRQQRVFRCVKARFSDACVKQVDRFGTASTMVCGGIRHQGKTDLIFINGRGRGRLGVTDVNVNKDLQHSVMWTQFCGM